MLGREFVEVGKRMGYEMIGWTRQELDLEKPEEGIRRLKELRPDAVIHCAAETNVDLCEREPGRARQVNAQAPGRLAQAAREAGSRFVFISTSGLFDGKKKGPFTEEDRPNPPTVYGRSKLEGEEKVRTGDPGALILRAGWLFGGPLDLKKNFVGARLREAEGKEVIRSATDKRGSPTWTRDFAERALELLQEGKSGLVHLVNAGEATRQEYVAEILRLAGRKTRVEGVDSDSFPRSAPVPDDERLQSIAIDSLRAWQSALQAYLKKQGSCLK
jgi:dTDP-4-dehydrorhamnose reductase